MTLRILFGVGASGLFLGAQALGDAANVDPFGPMAWARAAVGVVVLVGLVIWVVR